MKVSNKLTMTNMLSRFFANFTTFFANFESHAIIYGVFLRAIREIALYTAPQIKKSSLLPMKPPFPVISRRNEGRRLR
jgi:hypothetical protein